MLKIVAVFYLYFVQMSLVNFLKHRVVANSQAGIKCYTECNYRFTGKLFNKCNENFIHSHSKYRILYLNTQENFRKQ